MRFGSFPCGGGSRNVERGPPLSCMGLFAVTQMCSAQEEARCSRQLEVMESRPESLAQGGGLDGNSTLGTLVMGF